MNLKKIFLPLLMACTIISGRASHEHMPTKPKQKFIFKEFKNKKECAEFLNRTGLNPHAMMLGIPPIAILTEQSNTSTDRGVRKKFTEAIRFLIYKNAYNPEDITRSRSIAFTWTLNGQKMVDPNEHQMAATLNAELALLFLELGADPFEQYQDGATYEDLIDALYQGSAKVPEIKSRNCNSWNWFAQDAECSAIKKVRNKIKLLKKQKEAAQARV